MRAFVIKGKLLTYLLTYLFMCQESIYNKLSDLNIVKSPGPDMLHPRVLYETRDVIAYPLFLI